MNIEIELKTKISRLKRFIKEHSTQTPKVERVSTKSSSNVKLPRLEIMKLTGEFTKWQTFYDSFEAAVEKNQSLSNIEKFNYLRSYLVRTNRVQLHCWSQPNQRKLHPSFELTKRTLW